MENKDIINLLYEAMKERGVWFVTNIDYVFGKKDCYKLNEYGKLADEKEENKVVKEINNYIGDGAADVNEAISLWLNNAMYEDNSINFTDSLHMDFKDEPIMDGIEASEVDLEKRGGPGLVKSVDITRGPNILEESLTDSRVYECMDCGEEFELAQCLVIDSWGNPQCPYCGSGDVAPMTDMLEEDYMDEDDRHIVIETGLNDKASEEVLQSLLGQLSDGIWENSPAMNKYWPNMYIDNEDGQLVVKCNIGYGSGFNGKDEAQIRNWLANKVKQIVKEEELEWDRNNDTVSCYLDRGNGTGVTVQDAYRVYDKLKGRVERIQPKEESVRQDLIDANVEDLTTEGGEDWIVFYLSDKELASYPFGSTFDGELPETREQLAQENNVNIEDIKVKAITKPIEESKEVKTEGINDPTIDTYTTGKWKVEIKAQPGKKPIAYFYDMSQDKTKFPEGQYTYSYYVETLLGKDGFGTSIDQMSALRLDNDVPAWTIEGEDLTNIANWLKDFDSKSEQLTESEHNLSKDLFGNEAEKRNIQKQKDFERDLQYVKDIMAGKTVIDDKYHEELDLDTAKKWLRNDYVYMNNLLSADPEYIDKKLAEELPEIFSDNKVSKTEAVEDEELEDTEVNEEETDIKEDEEETVDTSVTPEDKLRERTQNLYNLLTDNGLDVAISTDNGENQVEVVLNDRDGKIIIPVREDNKLEPITGGSISLDEESLKVLDQVKDILNNEEV